MKKQIKQGSRRTASSLPKPLMADLLGSPLRISSSSAKNYLSNELRQVSLGSHLRQQKIDFGKPPAARVQGSNTSAMGSGLIHLVKQATSSGVSKLVGGGLIGLGVSQLFTQAFDFFGGSGNSAQLPALVRFTLPNAKDETLYSSQSGASVNTGPVGRTVQTGLGIYNGTNSRSTTGQAAIVSAVKNALLTSSTLNDVIGEL